MAPPTRGEFLNLAGLCGGGIVFLALLLGRLSGTDPLSRTYWTWEALGWGVLAAVPMFAVLFAAPSLKDLIVDRLGATLSQCTVLDLFLLAALAGFGEELLFRGVLQPWIGRWHPLAGLILANVIFGILHALTPLYAVVATLIGFYFSFLIGWFDPPNLLPAMVAHGVYDFVALLVLVREYRLARTSRRPVGETEESGPRVE